MDEACAFLASNGVQMVELGCGGFPGKAHCDPAVLLNDEEKLEQFKAVLEKNNLEISALSTHGNAVHPDPEVAKKLDAKRVSDAEKVLQKDAALQAELNK